MQICMHQKLFIAHLEDRLQLGHVRQSGVVARVLISRHVLHSLLALHLVGSDLRVENAGQVSLLVQSLTAEAVLI